MTKITFLIIFAFSFVLIASAQTIDVATGLNDPKRLYIEGNDLYFTDANSVFKFDVNEINPTPELIVSGLITPTGVTKSGNTLYVAEFNGGRISKIDLSNPVREDFVTGLNTPNFLLLDGDFLYYSDNNSNIVERFDITLANPTAQLIASSNVNFKPTGLSIKDNILYMGQSTADRVSSVDVTSGITQPDLVVAGLERPLGITVQGGKLYIAEFIGNLISEYNLEGNPPTLTDIVTGLSAPRDIAFSNSTLFIIEGDANKISKVENVLSTPGLNEEKVTLYPNPASNLIKIDGIKENISYSIYSVLGKKIQGGDFNPAGEIEVTNLKSGTYFIQLGNKTPLKFVKK